MITVLSVAGVSIGQWLGFVLETLPELQKLTRWQHVSVPWQSNYRMGLQCKVRGKETAGSKNKNSRNRQFFEGIRKYRIYISSRGRRNVWTGK